MKLNKKRTLCVESLESRQLLSAVSLTSVEPTGTGAACWTESIELEAGTSQEITFNTSSMEDLSVYCINTDSALTYVKLNGSGDSIESNKMFTTTSVDVTTSFQITNNSGSSAHYTLIAFSGSKLESEFQGTWNNNARGSAELLSFTTVSNSAKQTVVLGELSSPTDVDCYKFTAASGKLNIQLHTNTASALTFEIYGSVSTSAKPLAYATNVDEFTAVLNQLSISKGTFYVQVHRNSEVSTPESVDYSLTVTEDCMAETTTENSSPLVNDLSTGLCLGQVEGAYSSVNESELSLTGETIRSIDSDGSRMAVVSYASSTQTVTLHLYGFTDSQWVELASYSFTNENSSGMDVSTFGSAVSVCGDSILTSDVKKGSVFLFTRDGSTLKASGLSVPGVSSGDGFGYTVLLKEKYAFISAPGSDVNGTNSGAVYVFQKVQDSWTSTQTLTGDAGNALGSLMTWDEQNSRLCVADYNSGKLRIFRQNSNHLELETTLTDLGSEVSITALTLDGRWLAVTCNQNEEYTVRLYVRANGTWSHFQTLTPPTSSSSLILNFGYSLSLCDGILAVSSPSVMEVSTDTNYGIVLLYQLTNTGENTNWQLLQTFQNSQDGAFGKSVRLNQTHLDVWDSLNQTVFTLTNIPNGDSWELNVTDLQTVSFTFTSSSSVFPEIVIEGPDGSTLEYTHTISSTTETITFTPTATGVHKIHVCAPSLTTRYSLNVTAGSVARSSTAAEVLEAENLSNVVTVEYAQQILVSSLNSSAKAEFATQSGSRYTLTDPQILNGNQIVWTVPDSVSNGTYSLTVSGLTATDGTTLATVTEPAYEYKGRYILNLTDVGSSESSVRRGKLELEITESQESLTVAIPMTSAEAQKTNIQISGVPISSYSTTYDSSTGCLNVIINPQEGATGTILVDAALNASFDSSATLKPGNSLVGTFTPNETREISLSLAANETINLALTSTTFGSARMELYQGETLLASDIQIAGDTRSQWIKTLKNTTESNAQYTIKLQNLTSEATDFTLEAISAQASTKPTASFEGTPQYSMESLASVTLDFSENVNLSTLAATDFQILLNGQTQTQVSVKSVTQTDGNHAVLTFSTPLTDGTWSVGLTADESIQSLSGTDFSVAAGTFTVDSVAPTIQNITFDAEKKTITVQFSEIVQSFSATFAGKINGQVSIAHSMASASSTWTLYWTEDLPSDYYTLTLTNITDQAGNVLETGNKTASLPIYSTETAVVEDQKTNTPQVGWFAQYMDGSQAFVHKVSGCVASGKDAVFSLEGIREGEQIAFSYMDPSGYSDPSWNQNIQAVWDQANQTVTVSIKDGGNPDLGGNGVFVMYFLRNANFENEDSTASSPAELTLSEIGTNGDQKIRQTSVMAKIGDASDEDFYRFTLSGHSTISANFVLYSTSGAATIQLYEERNDSLILLAETEAETIAVGDSSVLVAWLENIRNSSSAEQTFQLKISASGNVIAGSTYILTLTENALFNAATNQTSETATNLYETNAAVGQVSTGISSLTSAGIYNTLNEYSLADSEKYIFVGDSENDAIRVLALNSSTSSYEQAAIFTTAETVEGDGFGTTVVLSGNTLAVSAPSHKNSDGTTGAVYLFTLDSTTGLPTIDSLRNATPVLTITNPADAVVTTTDFGRVMDYSEYLQCLVVGTQQNGSVYYFVQDSSQAVGYSTFTLDEISITLNLKLNEDGSVYINPETGNAEQESAPLFGYSVAIDDSGIILVGAPGASHFTYSKGSEIITDSGTDGNGYNGMSFYFIFSSDSITYHWIGTQTDLMFGYSVDAANGILVMASVPTTSSLTVRTIDLTTSSPSDIQISLTDFEYQNTEPRPEETLKLRNGHLFITASSATTEKLLTECSSSTWPFNYNSDVYTFTADGDSITLDFSTGFGSQLGNLGLTLMDSSGKIAEGTVAETSITYSVTPGATYTLYVSATEGTECDYVMTAYGITRKDYAFEMTDLKVNGEEFSETLKLTACPTSVTLTLEEAVRSDLISNASVKIDGVSASGFTLSEDGKTITFTFAHKQFTETSATLQIKAEDFCTLDGSVLELNQSEYTLQFTQATATQKIRAREDSTQVVWTFSENLAVGAASSAQVTVTKNAVNITSNGTLSVSGNQLIWTAKPGYIAQTDDEMMIYVNASSIQTQSGVPVQELPAKTYKINLNVQAETELVVRKTSSMDEEEGSQRAKVPSNETWVDEWSNLWVETWAAVISSTGNGLKTYTAEISYDPALFSPFKNSQTETITVNYDSDLYQSVSVTKMAGTDKIRVTATVKDEKESVGARDDEGNGNYALVASICFYAKGGVKDDAVETVIQSEAIGLGLVNGSISIDETAGTTITTVEDVTQTLPPVYPVVYDLNDSGSVEVNDLVTFARNFGKSPSDSTIAALCNFDGKGNVGIDDLVLFAKNFGKKIGETVTFAQNLTKDWGTNPPNSVTGTLEEFQEKPVFQTCIGNVYVTDWTALAPDFASQIEAESALRAEILDSVLAPETPEVPTATDSVLDELWVELTSEEPEDYESINARLKSSDSYEL